MEMTMPYRTLIYAFLFGSCFTLLSEATNSTESYIYQEHPTNHSSIISVLTKDVLLEDNSSLIIQNAREASSDVKDESTMSKDHAELLDMVHKHDTVDHDSHTDHMNHGSHSNHMNHGSHMHHMNQDHDSHLHHEHRMEPMMRDQAPSRGNDLSKTGTDMKDHDSATYASPESQDQAGHGAGHSDMSHKDHDNMNHKDHDGMDHKDHDNMDHKDHDNMDHDGMNMHMNGSDMHGMMMWFHAGISEVILFRQWKVTTVGGMIGSVIGIALLGMLYEGLKYYREYLFKQYVSSMQFATVAVTGESGRVTQVHKVEKHRMLSIAHAIQTFLHVLQIVISYFLMLIFMTYNIWLCLGVVIGAGVGYFIFGWKKATVVDITEHCH